MNWASRAIDDLRAGRSTTVTPHGNSMLPLIKSGQRVSLDPVTSPGSLDKGDVVLVRVNGNVYLHLIHAVDGDRYLIGNNKGRTNGWVRLTAIYGRAIL